ncbi:MAG: DUF1232 domain-containing protein [Lachnospiraceae bacterium]|nr:DUF1232 domain-containing protein [Lachnospiraceae bacterium]
MKKYLTGYVKKAKEIVKDEGALRKIVQGARVWLLRQKDLPFMGETVEDMVGVIDLLTDYADGKYRRVPGRILAAMVAGILYVVSPVNLIPDWIPLVGWLDDVAVFAIIMDLGVSAELKKYRVWKQERGGKQADADRHRSTEKQQEKDIWEHGRREKQDDRHDQ